MAIQYYDVNKLRDLLTRAWQKNQGNDWDPANGQWYTDGANHDGIGLYGGMTDTLDSVAFLETDKMVHEPESYTATYSDVDNTNGLLTGASMVTLSHTYSDSTTFSQSSTDSVRVGMSETFSMHAMIPGLSIGASTTLSMDVTTSTSETNGETKTASDTFSQSVPVSVPKGKIYRAILTYVLHRVTIPYHLNITMSGTTETWYESRWNDHYNWINSAAGIIGPYLADNPSAFPNLSVNGNQIIARAVNGSLAGQLTSNFHVSIIDITDPSSAPNIEKGNPVDMNAISKIAIPLTTVPTGLSPS